MAMDEYDLGLLEDDDNADGVQMTVVDQLREMWSNERAAPELLPYEADVVDGIKERIDIQQGIVAREAHTPTEQFELNLYRQEMDRVKFMLASYLRCRLHKIEKFALYLLLDEQRTQRLSPKEYDFAVGYADLYEKHLMLSFLNNIPASFRSVSTVSREERMVTEPDLDAHVVVRVNEDIGAHQISEDDEVELSRGDVLFATYRPFQELLAAHRVSLV